MQDVLKFYKITSAEILKRRRALYLFISERGGEVTCSTTEKIRQLKAAVLCMFANSPSRGMWRPSTNRETARQTKQWWGHHKYPRYMYPRVHNMEGPPSLLYTLDVVTSNIHQFSFLRYSNFFSLECLAWPANQMERLKQMCTVVWLYVFVRKWITSRLRFLIPNGLHGTMKCD